MVSRCVRWLKWSSAFPASTSRSRSHRADRAIQHGSLQLPNALARCSGGHHSTMISPPSLLTLSLGNRNCNATILSNGGQKMTRVNPAVLAIYSLVETLGRFSMDNVIAGKLEQRLGRLQAKQRLGIEKTT